MQKLTFHSKLHSFKLFVLFVPRIINKTFEFTNVLFKEATVSGIIIIIHGKSVIPCHQTLINNMRCTVGVPGKKLPLIFFPSFSIYLKNVSTSLSTVVLIILIKVNMQDANKDDHVTV
jgi:hypothetical protein